MRNLQVFGDESVPVPSIAVPLHQRALLFPPVDAMSSVMLKVALLCFLPWAIASSVFECATDGPSVISRRDFPPGFVFGTGSSAYQIEGAVNEGGKGPTVMDKFAHIPGNVQDGSNADVAADNYHRYKEDVDLLNDIGVNGLRISIAWARIFPEGRGEHVNQEGVDHYNDLINSLLEKGIQPYVTLSHWDLPLALELSYGGWLSQNIIQDFAAYAKVCFEAFGDRVKHWITFNEPNILASMGYNSGIIPPQRCSQGFRNCTAGNSSTEPYIVHHHMLLAHAAAAKVYREQFQGKQGGQIGIIFYARWMEPFTDAPSDIEAARRGLDFELGWGMHPVIFGDYPSIMRQRVGSRLPNFTKEESVSIKGSVDFVGLNHYTSVYVSNDPPYDSGGLTGSYQDVLIHTTSLKDGVPIGIPVYDFNVVPWGIWRILNHTRWHYNNVAIVITENGIADMDVVSDSNGKLLQDKLRVTYFEGYIRCLRAALSDGANVQGYMTWSFLDSWEWFAGYVWKYGLFHVDQNDGLKRVPKQSALWFKQFLRGDYTDIAVI